MCIRDSCTDKEKGWFVLIVHIRQLQRSSYWILHQWWLSFSLGSSLTKWHPWPVELQKAVLNPSMQDGSNTGSYANHLLNTTNNCRRVGMLQRCKSKRHVNPGKRTTEKNKANGNQLTRSVVLDFGFNFCGLGVCSSAAAFGSIIQ